MPKTKEVITYMDDLLVLLQAKLDEAKSKGNVNDDIKILQSKLDKLKIQAELDPKAAQKLADSIGKLINQKIVISNIGIDAKVGAKAGQEYGKQISQGISQGMSSASKSTEKVLRDFSELNDAKRKFVDGHDLISKDDIADAERLYDTVRKAFSEFGQVTVSKGSMNDGSLENMRVKIEQVNGEMKITRDFMLYFNENKNGFKLVDDDTIRTTEKMVQHLNEEKNIINATNEEANAIKEKLAEQEKYYGKLGKATKEQIALEKQRITAGEKQLEILDAQSKRRDSRISYNEHQIDKKGLSDVEQQRKLNDLSYAGQEKIDASFGREIDKTISNLSKLKEKWQEQGIYVDEFKSKVELLEKSLNEIAIGDVKGLNTFKEQISSLSTEAKQLSHIHEIQLSTEGKNTKSKNYDYQIDTEIKKLKDLGFTDEEVAQKVKVLTDAQAELKRVMNSSDFDSVAAKNHAIIESDKERTIALNQVRTAYGQLKNDASQYYNLNKQTKLSTDIQNWLSKNSRASKEAKESLNAYYRELSNGRVSVDRLNYIEKELKDIDAVQRGLGKLGKNLKDQFKEAGANFTQWLSVSSGVMLLISKTKDAITEIKELDNILTEISKTSDLTSQQLKQLGMDAYDAASKYGRTASDYLLGVQEMARSGFYGDKGTAMAEQSLLAQSAGDLNAELANNYVLATNAAYKLNGEADKLNAILDGQNSITNKNSVAMADMATAMSEAGTVASSYRVSIEDLSAMIGTIESVTKLGGSEVGNAIKAILINLQNVTSDKIVDTLDVANASMTEFVNGAEKLRNPIDILRDLAKTFNQLDEDDPLRAEILTNIGQKYHAAKLGALLQNMEMFDKMLVDYSEGTGSALEESNKSAENLTGTFNKLSNSWTEFVNNIINSDGLKAGVNLLNKLVEGATSLTSKLGSLGTIGFGAGLFAGFKNAGRVKCNSSQGICLL